VTQQTAILKVAGQEKSLLNIKSMKNKTYQIYGIDSAMFLLRPNAKWEITNNEFTRWDDPRPCPSIEEVHWVMDRIKEFEESIPTIWLEEDLKSINDGTYKLKKGAA